MQLDDHLKELMKELGSAINESISDSDRIAEAIANIKASGYDVFLVLEAAVGFQKNEPPAPRRLLITSQDRRLLGALKIRVDEESREGGTPVESGVKFKLTAQDAKFLRALKITIDEEKK